MNRNELQARIAETFQHYDVRHRIDTIMAAIDAYVLDQRRTRHANDTDPEEYDTRTA